MTRLRLATKKVINSTYTCSAAPIVRRAEDVGQSRQSEACVFDLGHNPLEKKGKLSETGIRGGERHQPQKDQHMIFSAEAKVWNSAAGPNSRNTDEENTKKT